MRVQDKRGDLGGRPAIEFDGPSHSRMHPCERALLGVIWTIGNGRKEEVSAR
jgi:hypothetical protein